MDIAHDFKTNVNKYTYFIITKIGQGNWTHSSDKLADNYLSLQIMLSNISE